MLHMIEWFRMIEWRIKFYELTLMYTFFNYDFGVVNKKNGSKSLELYSFIDSCIACCQFIAFKLQPDQLLHSLQTLID
jgi:hypothetical protein